MRRAFMRAMWGLRNDQRGAVLLYVTFSILPLLMVVGVAIDLARVTHAKQKLTNAADAAALAVGAQPGLTLDAAKALAQSFVVSHFSGTLKSVDVSDTGTQVNVTVAATVPMTFMQVFSSPSIDITVGSLAVRPQGKLEIALVLDQTGSMAGQRITNLKAAAKDLVDIVVWDNQTADYYSKVALVPYAVGVNAGTYADSVRGPIGLGTCLGCLIFQFLNPSLQIKLHNISTCVSERTGAQAFTDAAPSTVWLGRNYPAGGNPCPSNTIVPLTNNKTLLKSQIDLLQAAGSTAGHIGLAWGWYMLSPNWGYLWPASQPADYSELGKLDAKGNPLLRKILILMTDGAFNTAYCDGVISKDSGSGSGNDSDHINCNAPNGSSFSQSDSLCTSTKAAGVIVYTIGFSIGGDQQATDFMTRCATDASHAYLASTGAELQQAFRDIATRIAALRLTN